MLFYPPGIMPQETYIAIKSLFRCPRKLEIQMAFQEEQTHTPNLLKQFGEH